MVGSGRVAADLLGAGVGSVGGLAVGDESVTVRECREQLVDLGAEGMLFVVACAVQPPHRPRAVVSGQRVQHREDRSGPHSGAEQHNGAGPLAQHEVPAWGGDVQQVADLDAFVQVATGRALSLDADPVPTLVGEVRQRVAAGQLLFGTVGAHPQREVLPRGRGGRRPGVVGRHE